MTTRKTPNDVENANAQEETKILDHHVLQTPGKQTSDMGVPGPIYFLIREQAKSLVAIKELKERVKSLEGVQDDVFQAVSGLQFQMDRSLQMVSCFPDMVKGELFSPKLDNVPQCISPAKATTNQSIQASTTKMPSTGMTRTDDGKKGRDHSESDSKQDSGLDSDCQAHGDVSLSLLRRPISKDDGDELLQLLDVIAQKGSSLWQRVEDCERLREEEAALETRETHSNQDVGGLLQNCRSLQRRLREANAEKGNLRAQLLYIERVAEEMQTENRQLEERLEMVMRDKQRLESQIHRLHGQFVVRKGIDGKQEQEQRQKKIGRLRSNEESRNRVTAILKETNVLELQRQLLMYIMENEVLVVKLEQMEELRLAGSAEAEKNELRMQSEVQQLLKEKNELQAALEESRMDLTAVQAKIRMLERALHAVSQDPDNCLSLDASGNSVRSQPASSGNVQQQRHLFNTGSSFHSLPPVLMSDGAHYLHEIQPFQDTSGYLNITTSDGIIGGSHNGLMSPRNGEQLAYRRSSTPIRSRLDIPGFGLVPVGKLLVPQESSRSCSNQGTKSSQSQALLNSIRSEFDPLTPTRRDNQLGKGNEFVDSLDVTPTKIFTPNALRDSPHAVTVPMSQMGNISVLRTPLIRQPQRTLRHNPDPVKRRSDGHIQNILNHVDEALL